MSRLHNVALLDKTLTALEELLLSASDDEILSKILSGSSSVDDIKSLIERQLIEHTITLPADEVSKHQPPAKTRRAGLQSSDRAIHLALLKRLSETRPDLSPRLSAVFQTGKRPTSKELDILIKELVQQGLLPKDNSGE